MKNFFRLAFALVACVLFGDTAWSQLKNPVAGSMTVLFKENNGATGSYSASIPIWLANPSYPEWNGRNTSKGNRIENADTSGISFPMLCSNGSVITKAMVNAYWDNELITKNTNPYIFVMRIDDPSWEMNCYGFATGLGYWIQSNGHDRLMADDWQSCDNMFAVNPGCVARWPLSTNDHAVRIDDLGWVADPMNPWNPYWAVTETTEKMAYAGVYKKVYSIGCPMVSFGIYKKK